MNSRQRRAEDRRAVRFLLSKREKHGVSSKQAKAACDSGEIKLSALRRVAVLNVHSCLWELKRRCGARFDRSDMALKCSLSFGHDGDHIDKDACWSFGPYGADSLLWSGIM